MKLFIKFFNFPTLLIGCVFLYITLFKFTLIKHSLISFFFTLLNIIFSPRKAGEIWNSALIEYWAAGLTYILLGIALLLIILLNEKLSSTLSGYFQRWSSLIGFYGVVIFVLISLLAPVLSPVNPYAQGDLATTRLVNPFTPGTMTVRIPPPPAGLEEKSWIEKKRRTANNYLLNRITRFTRSAHDTIPSGQNIPEEEYQTSSIIFLLGTDSLARDILSRIIYGTRISVGIGFAATLIAMSLGTFIGLLAGFFYGITDKILMRIVDLFIAIPAIFLVITLVAFLGRSITVLIFILAAAGWMTTARLVRAEVLKLREREFVLAAKLLGASWFGIFRSHLLPNVLPVILTGAVLQLGNVILAEAALSFLGLGTQPPIPSWGNIIGEATPYLRTAWWIAIFPGLALSMFVISAHLIIEGAQEKIQSV